MRTTETAHEPELPASTRLFDFLSRVCFAISLLLCLLILLTAAVGVILFFMDSESLKRLLVHVITLRMVPLAASEARPDPFWDVTLELVYAYIIPVLFALGLFFWFLSRAGKSWSEGDVVAATDVEVTQAAPNNSAALRRRRRRQR